MGFIGTGQAKLLLFGEHAAVYGYPAVGLSLPANTTVRINIIGSPEWGVDGLSHGDRENVKQVLSRIRDIVPRTNLYGKGCIQISSTIPRGLGFGSSAALCTAIASAFYELLDYAGDLDQSETGEYRVETVWNWAHEVEHIFHGTPSGIDTGLSVSGGLNSFKPNPLKLPEKQRIAGSQLNLVVGAVPRLGNTGDLVGDLKKKICSGDRRAVQCIDELGQLAEQAIRILERGNNEMTETLGDLASHAHSLLRQLDLSSSELDDLLDTGCQLGATGGKLSGAGGGGAFYLIMHDRESALAAVERLKKHAEKTAIVNTIKAVTYQSRNFDHQWEAPVKQQVFV